MRYVRLQNTTVKRKFLLENIDVKWETINFSCSKCKCKCIFYYECARVNNNTNLHKIKKCLNIKYHGHGLVFKNSLNVKLGITRTKMLKNLQIILENYSNAKTARKK